MPFWVTYDISFITVCNYSLSITVSFITVCKRWNFSTRSFCRHQHWGSLHVVTRKLDLDQTSMARKHTERQMWENSLFNQASWRFKPISSKFCRICYYYVCFGLLMQISLADYSAYLHELWVSCTLRYILTSISGWFLNFKTLFSNSAPLLNLNQFSEYCIN